MENHMKTLFCLATFLLLSNYAVAQDGTIGPSDFAPRDAADAVFGRAGDLSGTPEERGQRIHDSTVDDNLARVQRNQGDAAMLREERIYREQHKY
jgi:hypothetical protein